MADTMTGHRCRVAVVAVDGDGPLARCPQCGNDGSIVAALRHGVVVVSDASAVETGVLGTPAELPLAESVVRRVRAVAGVPERPRGVLVEVAGGFAVQERLL